MIVAAVARNGVIGAGGSLPWHLPEDLRRFKALTLGHALVMGRTTYDSIGRPLPGRTTVVLTRQPGWAADGVLVAGSLEAALAQVDGAAYVVGGAQVYALALPLADRLEITEVDASPAGDTWFPPWDPSLWRETAREPSTGCTFVSYVR